MKLQEAIDIMLVEASVQGLTNYMENVKRLFDQGKAVQGAERLSQMLNSVQPIKGKFEAADQGKLKSLADSVQQHMQRNQSKVDKETYNAALQSMTNLQKTIEQARANIVGQQQQVTKRKMEPARNQQKSPSAAVTPTM